MQFKRLTVFAFFALAIGQAAVAQVPAKPSVEQFFSKANIASPQLSPSGKYLSFVMLGKNGRYFLGVVDTGNVGKIQIVAKSDSLDMLNPSWINDERLYFYIQDTQDPNDNRNGEVYAINRDGSDQTQIITSRDQSQGRKRQPLRGDYRVHDALNDGSDDLLVGKLSFGGGDGSVKSERLYRLNSKTLELTDVLGDLQPKQVTQWLMDKDNKPRFAFSQVEGRAIIYYQESGTKDWVEISNEDIVSFDGISPAFMDGSGRVFVQKNNAKGFRALYLFDPKTRKLAEAAQFELPDFDAEVTPVFESKTRRLLGLRYENDAPGTIWFDPALKIVQKAVDERMSATVNNIACRADSQVCLVSSFSDRDPGRYYLFKPERSEWVSIGAVHNEIRPEQQGRKDFFRFTARDGMKIPVYVTMPAGVGGERRPAVVYVHGGPTVRGGHWRWNREVQFMASLGYVVIEPDFRGSTGYGVNHMRAGWRQWGLSMQDDLTDAAKWAVDKGWVDADRIAIAGASYGGYATLMGLIKTPEVFRCGVDWVGVTDIDLLYSVTWSDGTDVQAKYGLPIMVGDRVKDAAQLRETSPLVQAARLKSPLLMAYGVKDRRVPLVHGTKFRDAVMQHNNNVEWVSYTEEGHGWRMENTNFDFWTRVERFLEKNLAPRAPR